MSTPSVGPWPRCPEAAAFFQNCFDSFAEANPRISQLAERFATEAGVDLAALVDHWILPPDSALPEKLTRMGLIENTLPEGDVVWEHPGARLPWR